MSAKKIIFITGTDTGVGKTLLAALLLHHLRETGVRALAMKPFCSGGLADVRLLQSLQSGTLSDVEMNPFYFAQPVAPLVARKKSPIRLNQVIDRIESIQKKCDILIIEGSGGLMVPLGEDFSVENLIASLDCRVIVAARNRLGTINHTLLTINALQLIGFNKKNLSAVVMSGAIADLSSRTNQAVIAKLISPISVFGIPFLGQRANSVKIVRKHWSKVKKTLAQMIDGY